MLHLDRRHWLRAKAKRFNPSERQRLFALTIAVGGVCGLAAVAFHLTIRAIEHRAIDRAFAISGPGWMVGVIAVPALGALVAGIVLQRFAPRARGSGVPQVKVAYALRGGRLRLRDSIAKFAISSLQIGTGSSLGREGPTVQICAGVASTMGRMLGVSAQNLRRLLPVGAAAGIAAAFNAPIAAVTFTIEEIVGTLDPTLLSGIVVAAAFAAVVERSVLGAEPVLSITAGHGLDHASSLLLYVALGITAALVSVVFSESLLRVRSWLAGSVRVPGWARPALGGLVAGGLAVVAMLAVRSRGIDGGGYDALAGMLSGHMAIRVALVLGALKLIATVCSYSTGGAGGLFAPALFIGAMLGGGFGALDAMVFGHPHAEVAAFALVGMGAVFAGTIRAPITSVLIIIEMTGGYSLALPLMITNMTAYAIARSLRPTPIYDALLEQDGVDLHQQLEVVGADEPPVSSVVGSDDATLIQFARGDGTERMVAAAAEPGRQEVFPVLDDAQQLIGLIALVDITALARESHLGELVRAVDLARPPVALLAGDLLGRALERLAASGLRQLPLLDDRGRVIALVDEAAVAHAYLRNRRNAQPAGS